MDRHLHIVALDTPYPVSYGGVFDIFYKLVALHGEGVKIYLHCFENVHAGQPELDKYCEQVYYYPRKKGLRSFDLRLPYMVSSRTSRKMTARMLADDHPILLEGIQCTSLLSDRRFAGRRIVLRLHNVEYKYYRGLYACSAAGWKKLYYLRESLLLKRYESGIASRVSAIAAVAGQDAASYQQEFGADNIHYLPVFPGFSQVVSREGSGSYCLYHGNLSVAENERMVGWLIGQVFRDLDQPLLIAGKDPSPSLVKLANSQQRVTLIANPTAEEMEDIIANAQVHILPSLNSTGIKLKLLHALYNGRHCVVNDAAIEGTGLRSLCKIAEDAESFKQLILQWWRTPFTGEDIRLRRTVLSRVFDEKKNIRQLIRMIW